MTGDLLMAGIGEILREARERKDVTFDDVYNATKIKKRYLQAMELEEWGRLPGRVYAKGFLRTYARFLDLDEQSMSDLFELSIAAKEAEKNEAASQAGDRRRRSRKPKVVEKPKKAQEIDLQNSPKRKVIIFLCVLSLMVVAFFVWAHQRYYLDEAEAARPTPPPIVLPQPEPEPEPEPQPEPEPEPVILTTLSLKLEATEMCWIRLKDKDALVYENTMRKGDALEFPDLSHIYIRLGNAGGVKLNINGIDLPILGASGHIVTKNFSITDGVIYDDDSGEALS